MKSDKLIIGSILICLAILIFPFNPTINYCVYIPLPYESIRWAGSFVLSFLGTILIFNGFTKANSKGTKR